MANKYYIVADDVKTQGSISLKVAQKVRDYFQLMKFTLSFTVVFSCVICYLIAPNVVENSDTVIRVILLFVGGMLVTGSANAINQALEKDTDALMKRTSKRPVASGRMPVTEAYTFAFFAGFAGIVVMAVCFNVSAALLSALSLFLYAYIYTPLKKVNSVAVLAGALPGALPCLIGWVAATGVISPFDRLSTAARDVSNFAGWALFGIQFLWQFPHFWAIAWVAHSDYSRAGFRLLPADKGPTKFTAIQAVMYSVLMIPFGILPYMLNISGQISLIVLLIANMVMVVQCVRLYLQMDVKAARRVMFTSYIYLPVVFLSLLGDKVV